MARAKIVYVRPGDLLEIRLVPGDLLLTAADWVSQNKPRSMLLQIIDDRNLFCPDPHANLTTGMQNKPVSGD